MSTRATYVIDGHAFYVHYDGYLEGGASYFGKAVLFENDRGGFACKFLRAVDLAEFTEGHDAHGDTEFQYTYDSANDILKVSARLPNQWDVPDGKVKWEYVFVGALATFLNMHHVNFGEDANAHADRGLWVTLGGRPDAIKYGGAAMRYTRHLAQVSLWVKQRLAEVTRQRANSKWVGPDGWNGNASSALSDICRNIGGELLKRTGQFDEVLALAHDYYDQSLVERGHNKAKGSYWREYFADPLGLPEEEPATP